MDEGSRKIKNFEDFMPIRKRYGKILSILEVKGSTKKTFFQKPVEFGLIIHYTPLKNIIVDIATENINIYDKRLNIDFKIGDHISVVRDWVERNGYKIVIEINR
jgi:hypothetical protein